MIDILIIDDEQDIGNLLKDIIEDNFGLNADFALNSTSAIKILEKTLPKVIILDIWLEGSDMDGLGLLRIIKENYKDTPVIIISGHGNIETAVKAIKYGAYDFIEKPFKSEKLILTIKRTLENSELKQYNYQLRQQDDLASLIGNSKQIIDIKNKITSNSTHKTRTFIYGEIGTGKEKLARLIHNYININEKPFFKINIENFTEQELNDTLFGTNDSFSIFDKAKGSTLYLNEISILPTSTQIKLLKYINSLQNYKNSSQVCKIISSSKNDIQKLVNDKKFNSNLYQRLCSLILHIPSLRDRKKDIPLIADYYIKKFSENYHIANLQITDDFYSQIIDQEWFGNVTELKIFVEYLILNLILSNKNVLDAQSTQLTALNSEKLTYRNSSIFNKKLQEAKKTFEKEYLDFNLKRFENNISHTAKFIGMERTALHKKIKDIKLQIS